MAQKCRESEEAGIFCQFLLQSDAISFSFSFTSQELAAVSHNLVSLADKKV